jgi:NADH:ubiquinone oxidoreductase subunit K
MYTISLIYSTINDDLNLLSLSLFILTFAGIEYSIGLVLLFLFREVNNSINFNKNDKNLKLNFNKKKKNFFNKYF